jgi:hypothetical protein
VLRVGAPGQLGTICRDDLIECEEKVVVDGAPGTVSVYRSNDTGGEISRRMVLLVRPDQSGVLVETGNFVLVEGGKADRFQRTREEAPFTEEQLEEIALAVAQATA